MRGKRFLVLLPLLATLRSGAQTDEPALVSALRLLDAGRVTLAEATLSQARDSLLNLQRKNPGNAHYSYQLSRSDSYSSRGAQERGDKKAAVAALDRAIDEAQRSIGLEERSADAHSLLADLYGRKIGFGGFLSGARLGPKIAAENKRAQELDGRNPRVEASLARQYLDAPTMFGGDLDRAIAHFQKSIRLDPGFDETYVWLAMAYRRKGDSVQANRALDEALRLNPNGAFARSVRSGRSF
jgi:tetratricopeptide (TPR) repeat protein